MTHPLPETSPSTRGRILATLYLVVIIAGVTAQVFIADRLVVRDDAARTAANILGERSLYRLAFTIVMIEMAAQMALSMMFYDLLKPVNRSVARTALIMGLSGSGKDDGAPVLLCTADPALGSQAFTGVALFAIAGVIATSGWLIIRGVDDDKWKQRAALAGTSLWR